MDRNKLAVEIAKTNPNNLSLVKQFSPVVIAIIEEVIRILLSKCNLNLKSINNPWFYERWLLKRYVNQARETVMKYRNGMYEPYDGATDNVYETLLAYGKGLNGESLKVILSEIQ